MQTKNNYERKNIWVDKEKFKSVQNQLTKQNWFSTATRVEALTYCLEKHVTLDWIKTDDDLKNFCFYFSDILKTHLYDEKENRWLENPFDDNNFCNAMFNLLNKDEFHLSRNCVLLLENFCLPDIHTRNQNTALFYSITINAMNLFFANKWTHMPKPSDQFMSFLRKNIRMCDIENYCTKFINSKLQAGLKPEELKSRKWIVVQENNNDIQTQNNFVISSLSLFLDKNFKYPFECEKNELDFIESAMNIYENMYQKFMDLPHSEKKDAIYDFFNLFSSNFIKHIICSYREDKTASIKYKHGIYLFHRFYLILQNDEEHLNLVLENLFKIIDIRQDFVLPYKNAYGTWNFIKCCGSIATNVIANKLSSEKSVSDLKNGQILNYEELLPDELIDKMKKYNDKSKSELQFDIKQEIFLIKNEIFYCDENKFLENIESICKIFGLISNKDGEAKKIDDIHLKDFFKLLADNKFNLFKYVCKLETCYGDVAIRGISFLISEFEKFIDYHSLQGETNKLFLSNSNDNTFTKKHLFPNPYVCSLYNLMITKFIKAQTKSDELAEIVSILLRRFGSIYNLINQVKNILAEKNYGYKLKGLWNFVLDCVLYVDKESNKSILSLLIKLVNDNLKKYLEKNDLEQGEIALSLVKSALLLFNVAKAFDYDTSIFFGGQEQKHKNDISNKTFDLLNKIVEDENFKLFFELDKTLFVDFTSIEKCFKQIRNLKFEVLLYLNDEIFNPNVKQLEEFFPLLKKCADICKEDGKTTIFDLIQQTEEFAQEKVSKMERINKIKNGAKKIKNYANEVKEHNLEDKNLFLDNIQTENERESRKANDLLKNLLKQAKKVVGSINVGERGEYLLHSDLLNQYFNSLYEIFCMVYDPKQHSNLKSEYKNTYREIISDSCNSTIVTKISELTVSAITGLNKKNIFEKTDELENIDIEIIGNIMSLLDVNRNNQTVFFKNENGENIISNVVGVLKQLQENLIDYKKKLRRFNTDQLLNELKNHKGQEISFGNKLIKKAQRKQDRLLNSLDIKSGQFDAELYKKKKKAMTQLTDLNIYTIKLIASLCILKSSDNYVANVADTVNHFCKKLHDFLDTLYVSEDEKNPNKEYKSICVEIISEQKHSEMVIEISKFTIDAIRFLNEKDIFEKVDCAKRDTDQNIDIKTVDSIISLLSNRTQKDIIFFKDENDQNITSNIIEEFKLLKTNLKINELRQKFQECKSNYPNYKFTFIESSNECFNDLYNFLSILKETKSDEQKIYAEVLSGKQNSQMFMLAETSNIILDIIKTLNSKNFDIEILKDIDANIIEAIIELLAQENKKIAIIFFKDEKGQNITSDIVGELKLLKTNLKINELRQKFQKYKSNQCVYIKSLNKCFKDLYNFLSILKETKSDEQKIYAEVLSGKQNSQMFMLAETSNIILDIIKTLNSKNFDRKKLKDIDVKTVDSIISLLSNISQEGIIFFKNAKGNNITSDIIDGLKLLKTNLKINELRQKFQECKSNYPNYKFVFIKSSNECFKYLHNFLSILKETKSDEQKIYAEVLSGKQNSQMFMLAETSNIILDIIKTLNSKNFDIEILDIDANIIEAIIELLAQENKKIDIIFFKDEKGQNITSDIIDGLKLLKTNFTDYIYNQENKKIVDWIDALKFSAFIASPIGSTYSEDKEASKKINKCLDCLYKVFCILYDTEKVDSLKPEYKEIYKRIICDSKNSELVLKMSQQTHQLINELNEQKVFDSIDNPKEIKIETIKSIISLLSNNHNEKTVLFKNKDGTNITSNIIDGLKSFKDKLLQYVNEKSNLQKSNENQMVNEIIVNEIKEKKEEHQNPENILETTSSEEINSNEKDELRNIYDNKNNDANNLQDNHDTIENLKKNKKINRENNVVDENENVSSTENDNKIKVHDENNTKKDNNEKQIGEKEQNLQDETDVKANDTLQLIKNAFDINNEETYHKTTNRRYSFSISQNTIKTALDNENASVKKRDKNDNKDKFDILTMQNEIDSSDINMTSNQNIKLSNDINLNNKVDDVKKNEIESNDYNPTTIDRKERKSQKVVIPQCYTNVESQKNMINNTNDKNDKSDNKKIEENNKISEIDNDQIQMNEDNYNQIKTEILSNSQEKNNISGETTNVDLKTSNSCETAEKKKVVNEESNAKNETQEKNDTIKNVFTTIKNLFADNHKRQSFTTERKYSSSTCLKKIISIDEKTDYPEKQKTKSNVKTKTSTDNSDKEKTNVNSKTDSLQGADYSKNNLHNLKSDIEIKCHHNSKSLCLFLKRLFIFIYQHKKLSISIMFVCSVFLGIGCLYTYWLAIAMGTVFTMILIIFLLGKYFSKKTNHTQNEKLIRPVYDESSDTTLSIENVPNYNQNNQINTESSKNNDVLNNIL